MRIEDCRIINLPKILDSRGNLSFLENDNQVPFTMKRSYWVYDVPGGEKRGGHSYKQNHEMIIALSGSFTVILDDAIEKKSFFLNRSYHALYIPNGIWRHLENFSTNALALVVASNFYDENDYERDYSNFLKSRSD